MDRFGLLQIGRGARTRQESSKFSNEYFKIQLKFILRTLLRTLLRIKFKVFNVNAVIIGRGGLDIKQGC